MFHKNIEFQQKMTKSKHTIRIIAGTHRSRRIPVLDLPGLRPTGDRIRETLFNWLQMKLPGKMIVDLCAGSGALGLEAASRGAKAVHLVETNKKVAEQLRKNTQDFSFENVLVFNMNAQSYLQNLEVPVDIVFLDPPFAENLIQELTELSLDKISINGILYREYGRDQQVDKLPENWDLLRTKTAGQVKIELWQKTNI